MDSIAIVDGADAQNIKPLNYNDIASRLLRDKFLLTALELHTELLESGKELKQLTDFFSNPGNFELNTSQVGFSLVSRSGSQATLDSLDLTRFSEDGAFGDDKIAVLEFELRKARETINSLRNNLTVATESENNSPAKGTLKQHSNGTIKPHEQRALNFLINEYLLLHSYKLTSITFADENESQDFDDWDDVGLNISKPPELLSLYRDGLKFSGHNCVTSCTQTESQEGQNPTTLLQKENEYLKLQLLELETKNLDLQNELSLVSSQINIQNEPALEPAKVEEKFEILDSCKNVARENSSSDCASNNSSNNDWTTLSITENDNTLNKKDNINKTLPTSPLSSNQNHDTNFKKEVFSHCYVNISSKTENDILNNVLNNVVTHENLVHVVSQSLLRIIPNIILNKREEAVPLLISAVYLNSNSLERDKLLQQLFNLKKRPNVEERQAILTGLIGIAKYSGESLVENEILPLCWEQIVHKYVERRLLVIETSIVVVPYISSPIRNSLVLSIMSQMLEDRDESVREKVVKGISLVASLCTDADKYTQCEELALKIINDLSDLVFNEALSSLIPVLGYWALGKECLINQLLKQLLFKLNKLLKEDDSPQKLPQNEIQILRILKILETLLPFLLIAVANVETVINQIEDKSSQFQIRNDLLELCTNLTNPIIFSNSKVSIGTILYYFDKSLEKNPQVEWSEMDRILDIFIPDLLNNLSHINPNNKTLLQQFFKLISNLCIVFGKNFTNHKIQPILEGEVNKNFELLSNNNQFSGNVNSATAYLTCVLPYLGMRNEIVTQFVRFLTLLPVCGGPIQCLEMTVERLDALGMSEGVLSGLWQGVVHSSPLVRAATASLFSVVVGECEETLLGSKVTPAVVTLAADTDILVKTAIVPTLGKLITDCNVKEIRDKAQMQLHSYITDNALEDNHILLRKIIVTLGDIVTNCDSNFRKEVILPKLAEFSSYTLKMGNQTRKIDLATALMEAYTQIVYSQIFTQNNGESVLTGLRQLEPIFETQTLLSQKDTISNMIRECQRKTEIQSPQATDLNINIKLGQSMNQGVEDMRKSFGKIFKTPNAKQSLNLQGIFKRN